MPAAQQHAELTCYLFVPRPEDLTAEKLKGELFWCLFSKQEFGSICPTPWTGAPGETCSHTLCLATKPLISKYLQWLCNENCFTNQNFILVQLLHLVFNLHSFTLFKTFCILSIAKSYVCIRFLTVVDALFKAPTSGDKWLPEKAEWGRFLCLVAYFEQFSISLCFF